LSFNKFNRGPLSSSPSLPRRGRGGQNTACCGGLKFPLLFLAAGFPLSSGERTHVSSHAQVPARVIVSFFFQPPSLWVEMWFCRDLGLPFFLLTSFFPGRAYEVFLPLGSSPRPFWGFFFSSDKLCALFLRKESAGCDAVLIPRITSTRPFSSCVPAYLWVFFFC